MRGTILLLTALGVAIAPPAAHGQAILDEESVHASVMALFAAVERSDLAALDTLYDPDVTVQESAGIDRTWPSYRDHHLKPELDRLSNFEYRPSEIEAHVAGDVGWAIFRYRIRGQSGQRTLDQVGRGTAILERRGGNWVFVHTHTASRPRRATDPSDW